MAQIINPSHSSKGLLFVLSRVFDRAGFYGLRSLIVIYMISGTMNIPQDKAYYIYSLIGIGLGFSQVIGALFGDLLLGNKKTALIGCIMQAIGAFTLCIPSIEGLYTGLALIILGGGLYTPNIYAGFGKQYLDRTKLLDAGYTFFYMGVNIGALLGPVFIGYFGSIDYMVGFILSGVVMLFSCIPLIFTKDVEIEKIKVVEGPIKKKYSVLAIIVTVITIYWLLYELVSFRIFEILQQINPADILNLPVSFLQSINLLFLFPFGVVAIVYWTYRYSSSLKKLTIGLLFSTLACIFLLLVPSGATSSPVFTYLFYILLMTISEVFISPVLSSAVVKYGHPKYLTILFSLVFLPFKLVTWLMPLIGESFMENSLLGVEISFVVSILFTVGLFLFIRKSDALLSNGNTVKV